VSKNTFLNNKLVSKTNIAIILAILAMLGFLVYRPLNSAATTLFGINALWNINPKHWLRQKWWWCCVIWVATYAITYFWSTDMHSWNERIDIKLPFLLLPLSFALLPKFSTKQLFILTISIAFMLLVGAGYSTYFYIKSSAYYIHQYEFSGTLPTPAESDHIVFSLCISLFIVWSVYFFPYIKTVYWKWFIAITAILLGLYLHLLSAKTGLVTLYIFLFSWVIYLIIKKNRMMAFGVIAALAIFSFFAWNYIPTFRQKILYVKYTYILYRQGEITGNYSDMGRVVSDKIAIRLIEEHPLRGVGAGDILEEMKKGYDRWYPQIKEEQRLFPHNQFLSSGVGCGILSIVMLAIVAIFPMLSITKSRQGFFSFVIALMLFVPLLVEPFLEIQFGVFVYLFFLLWIWCIPITPAEQE